MADIRGAIEPRSDQLNYVDFMAGPAVFTIHHTEDYHDDKGHKRVAIYMVEKPDRPFKASATNVRLMAIAWTDDDKDWPGRRVKLGGDPEVTFGREKVGGIRVLALSHLAQPFTAKLSVGRNKRQEFRVERLDDAPAPPPVPAFASVDEARTYYTERHKAGATAEELTAIQQAASNVTTQNEEN